MKVISVLLIAILFPVLGFSQCGKEAVEAFRQKINSEYADPAHSPLKAKDLKTFKSLDFFPIDLAYCVTAKFIRTTDAKPFNMPTTGKRKPLYVKYGEVHFTLGDKNFKLNVYQNLELIKMEQYKKHLFLPFTDYTSGVESYGGGRYIDLELPETDILTIDFNQAYNPYCAYSEGYSCPIPPQENDLKTEIKAGVKTFKK